MFKKLEQGSINEVEEKYVKMWKDMDIYHATIDAHKDDKNFVFHDGPAFANGFPGLHHMVAKNLKDALCKYNIMKGHHVIRKIGWDTHGLPVENHVEKKLGLESKKDIEKFGIGNFNAECRKSVGENTDAFNMLTDKMGQFIDVDNPYVTYKNEYIETEWYILSEFYKKNLFYEGVRIVPYCPRCGTGLANFEVAQGYKETPVNTVFIPFKVKNEKNTYFLAWTTTPWTLYANVALCVNPDEVYVKCLSRGYNFILAKKLAKAILGEDIEIVEEYKGKELEYREYEQLIPEANVEGKAFFVTCDSYVTMEDGTGIVHMASAFGQDDYDVCMRYGLPMFNPVGKDGCYTEGPWKGRLVVDPELEVEIIKYLAANDKLFKKQKITHDYPHCWRCGTPLVYYAMPSYYIKVSAFKDDLVKANKKVNWYPDYIGEKRFANWLENAKDWNISRSRYWGAPIPLWKCECGHDHMVSSIKELKEMAIEEIKDDELDLHRPYIDNIHLKCPKCGKPMTRILDVLDCWFDSGSMPFAQYHWPFENKELWESQFPADFICEGIDQTRGWFYSLIVISVFLKGCAPYKNVLVNDLLLDKEGKKMSKSRGNIVEPFTTMKEYGADTVRFYLPYVSPVWTPLKFDKEGLKEIYSKYISTFKNAYSFFEMYANADNIDPRKYNIPVEKRDLIDRWLISRLNSLVKEVTKDYDEYDLNKVTKAIIPFLNDDLSNWYIRSNRRRFWDSELSDSKKSVYLTMWEALVTLCKLCAPLTPFITEEIYQKLTDEKSVHLASFPTFDNKLIDKKIEKQMDLVREVCSLGRFAREEVNIKVRQPLSNLILPFADKKVIGELLPVIQEELNVKNITFKKDLNDYLDYVVKPNFKEVGKILGPRVKLLSDLLDNISTESIEKIKNGGLSVNLGGDNYTITEDMVNITLKQKSGYASVVSPKTCVVLDTTLTNELVLEGLAREFVRNVQALRKEADLVITDHIKVSYNGDERIEEMLDMYKDYVSGEVLADKIVKNNKLEKSYELNDELVGLKVERV